MTARRRPAGRAREGVAAAARAIAFATLWLVLLPSAASGDVAMGTFATLCATWASLRLLPPGTAGVRPARLLLHVPRLFVASIAAGFDVARRALSPRPALRPGFVEHPTAVPRGFARTTFETVTSLLPGTVAAGERDDAIVYHALDVSQPAGDELRAEELRLGSVLRAGGDA